MSKYLKPYKYTITVLNKLKGQDSATKFDVWYKTVLHNSSFTTTTISNISGTTVSVGGVYTVRVPYDPNYKPYSEWIDDPTEGFTFSIGDIIIKGEIEESITTPQEVSKILQKYQPNAFTIRASLKDNTGVMEFGQHYHIEGV